MAGRLLLDTSVIVKTFRGDEAAGALLAAADEVSIEGLRLLEW